MLVEAVLQDALARLGGRRVALDERSQAPFWSSIIADSEPRHRALRREERRVDLTRLVAELGEAERVGEPARRIDREHDRPPALERAPERDRRRGRRLADAAAAGADDDVVSRTRLAERQVRSVAPRRVELRAASHQRAHLVEPELLGEEERQLDGRHRHLGAQPLEMPPLIAAQPASSRARRSTSATSEPSPRRAAGRPCGAAGPPPARAARVQAVHDEHAERHAAGARASWRYISIVSLTGISSAIVTGQTAVRAVASSSIDLLRLALHEPRAERVGRGARHAEVLQPVARRRRVDDDRVPLRPAPSFRFSSYQILPTVMSSFSPGAAATKYW